MSAALLTRARSSCRFPLGALVDAPREREFEDDADEAEEEQPVSN